MIVIDGSIGEGGGQILRSSLSLSMLTGTPVTINNIRARRRKTGLMRQHLTAVNAAAAISHAEVKGNTIGSMNLTFIPGTVTGGTYHFAVGTAGSATLVLQTILPPLLIADNESHVTLEGGTHNPMAPPFDFLDKSFLPIINKMGPQINTELLHYGFYPAGGGKYCVSIKPVKNLKSFDIKNRGPIINTRATGLYARLPVRIVENELIIVKRALTLNNDQCRPLKVDSNGPGNALIVEIETKELTAVFTAFGAKKIPLEDVASDVINQVNSYLSTNAAVGPYLADQLLIPFAMAGGGTFWTGSPTMHTKTNIDVLQRFMEISINRKKFDGAVTEIIVS